MPSFQRRHYEFLADVLKEFGNPERTTFARVLAYALARDNPKFDPVRFLKACAAWEEGDTFSAIMRK